MAKARLVCGECGTVISRDDASCTRCGAIIEYATSPQGISGDAPPSKCEVCGRINPGSGAYCESCGAQLSGASRPVHNKKNKKSRKASFEPWQMIAGTGLVLLVGFFVYSEVTRVVPSPPETHNHPPVQSATSLADIEQLQKTVDANPSDGASLLKLANLLHDNAATDMRLFFRAADTYRKYLAMVPDDPNARVDLGICYFQLTKVDSAGAASLFSMAIAEMKRAFTYDSTHQPAAFNLGIVYLSTGNTEASTRWFTKAVELNAGSELGKRARNMLEQHAFQPSPN